MRVAPDLEAGETKADDLPIDAELELAKARAGPVLGADRADQPRTSVDSVDTGPRRSLTSMIGFRSASGEDSTRNTTKIGKKKKAKGKRKYSFMPAISYMSDDRTSFVQDHKRLQTLKSQSSRNMNGSGQNKKRKVRAVVDQPWIQAVSHACLALTLFLPDIWIVMNVSNSQDVILNTILVTCMTLFVIEMILTYYAKPSYNYRSFFFWMDVIGTLSILIDITWIVGRDTNFAQDGTTLRVARLAKLGAKSSRLARLVKVFKYLRKKQREMDNSGETSTVISRKLGNIVATRVACLVLFLVVVSPFLQVNTFDYSQRSMVNQLQEYHNNQQFNFTANQWNQVVTQYWDFYSAESSEARFVISVPLKVTVENLDQEQCPTGERWVSWQRNEGCSWDWTSRSGTVRAAHKLQYNKGGVTVHYDITTQQREDAGAAMILIVIVVLLLLSFSASFNLAVERLVVLPIQRIMGKLQRTASAVMTSLSDLPDQEDADLDISNSNNRMTETDMLEIMVNKLTRVVNNAMSNSVDQLVDSEQVDEHTEKWLNEYSNEMGTGTYSRRVTAGSARINRLVSEHAGLPVTLEVLNSFELDVLSLEAQDLKYVIEAMFSNFHLDTEFEIPIGVMDNFLKRVQTKYRQEPSYHNWYHGVDVAHTTYRLLAETRAEQFFDKSEILALLTAAVAHDVNHPGVNNGFLIKTSDKLAIKYNDRSPLENMHCATLYEILHDDECNIMRNLKPETFIEVRKQVLTCILNTDMAFHVQNLGELQNFYELYGPAVLEFMDKLDSNEDAVVPECLHDKKHRILLQESFLHCADLSNPIKPLHVYKKWVDRVTEEFFSQGDAEKEMGMAPSPMCDRDSTNIPNMQVNFIDFVIVPMFSCLFMLFPKHLLFLANNLKHNHAAYVDERVGELPDDSPEIEKLVKRKAALDEKLSFLDFSAY